MKTVMKTPVLAIALLCLLQPFVLSQGFSEESVKFSQVLNWIDKQYVDSINKAELTENAIIQMLKSLDPHSTYLTKEEVKEMQEPLQGNFEGIGVSFNILDDTIFIINPIPNGPSEQVGIIAGDRIILIEGENVAGIGIRNNDVFDRLRGRKGTQVTVSILRRSEKELLEFTITRDRIPIFSLDASYMINDEIGYIKLNRFSFTTMEEFHTALAALRSKGMKDLILDLSGNGGGYMDVAIQLADQFLDERKLIVYTEGHSHPKRKYFSSAGGSFKEGRVAIIIDQGSASASEIVAGAIQDWDRGVIVGRRSFGKGLVQNPIPLIDGSMVRLTIARYYTPTGRLIQKSYEDGYEAYTRDLINRFNAGELSNADSVSFPESLRYQTLLSHRPVYGGGGIMPDYFVPIDTVYITDYHNKLLNRGILNSYVLNYIDDHRNDLLGKYGNIESYLERFKVGDAMLEGLTAYAGEEGIPFDSQEFESSKERIRLVVKAFLARDLWSTSEFYEVLNTSNTSVLKAKELLESREAYQALLQDRKGT